MTEQTKAEPTANSNGHDPSSSQERILRRLEDLVGNVMMARSELFRSLMDPRRDLDAECGYPPTGALVPIEILRELFDRDAIACRTVELMPKECWVKSPMVYESEDPDEITDFELAWDELGQQLRGEQSWHKDEEGSPVWEMLRRADIRSGIGYFGVLLLGIDDGLGLDQPADGVATVPAVMNLADSRGRVGRATCNVAAHHSTPSKELEWKAVVNLSFEGGKLTVNASRVAYDVGHGDEPVGNAAPVKKGQPVSIMGRPARKVGTTSTPPVPRTPGGGAQRQPWGYQGDWNPQPPFGPQDDMPSGLSPRTSFGSSRQLSTPDPLSPGAMNDPTSFRGAEGTDRQYDQWQLAGGTGTDRQYVGTQLGPPEYPAEKPSKAKRKLLFLRTFDESLVQVVQFEADLRNPRFGQPVMYRITLNDPREQHSGIGLPMATVRVHWSRVVHLADDRGTSQVFGVPRMRPVLNRILDARKIYGADGEAYWKSAFAGIALSTHPQLGGDVEIDKEGIRQMMADYNNSLQRWITLMGMEANTLAPSVSDPTPHLDKQIEAICIQKGCPVRVFKGAERGELASSQDDEDWKGRVRERQANYLTPLVIVPFIDRCIAMGVLPEPTGNVVKRLQDPLKEAAAAQAQQQQAQMGGADGQGPGGQQGQAQGTPQAGGMGAVGRGSVGQGGQADGTPQTAQPGAAGGAGPQDGGGPGAAGAGVVPGAVLAGPVRRPGVANLSTPSRLFGGMNDGQGRGGQAGVVQGDPAGPEEDDEGPMDGDGRGGAADGSPSSPSQEPDQDDDEPHGYSVEWPDVDTMSQTDKANVANTLTTALGAYVSQGVEALISPIHFLTAILKFDEEEAKSMLEAATSPETAPMTMPASGMPGHPATPPPAPMDPVDQAKLDADTQVKVAGAHAKAPGFGKTEVSGSMTQVQGDQHQHPAPGQPAVPGKGGLPGQIGPVKPGAPAAQPQAPGAVSKPPRPAKPPIG